MAEVLLFHHAQGLTPGVVAFANKLRGEGHIVHTPDLYGGRIFDVLDAGLAYSEQIGVEEIIARGVRAADDLPAELVYIGFSLGVMPAQKLAQTRLGAVGAVLIHSCVPSSYFGTWPSPVPVRIHAMDADPFFTADGDAEAARTLVDEAPDAELYLYPGDRHLFVDSSLPSYDPEAAALLLERTLAFLRAPEAHTSRPVVEVTLDCADATRLGEFWTQALGYVDRSPAEDPKRGFAWLADPQRNGPHLCLLEVPEPKIGKNRMHLDLAVSGDGTANEKWQRIEAEVDRLRALGATILAEYDHHHVTMADPEDNEFDVC